MFDGRKAIRRRGRVRWRGAPGLGVGRWEEWDGCGGTRVPIFHQGLFGVGSMAEGEGPPDPEEGGSFPSACLDILSHSIIGMASGLARSSAMVMILGRGSGMMPRATAISICSLICEWVEG